MSVRVVLLHKVPLSRAKQKRIGRTKQRPILHTDFVTSFSSFQLRLEIPSFVKFESFLFGLHLHKNLMNSCESYASLNRFTKIYSRASYLLSPWVQCSFLSSNSQDKTEQRRQHLPRMSFANNFPLFSIKVFFWTTKLIQDVLLLCMRHEFLMRQLARFFLSNIKIQYMQNFLYLTVFL